VQRAQLIDHRSSDVGVDVGRMNRNQSEDGIDCGEKINAAVV